MRERISFPLTPTLSLREREYWLLIHHNMRVVADIHPPWRADQTDRISQQGVVKN